MKNEWLMRAVLGVMLVASLPISVMAADDKKATSAAREQVRKLQQSLRAAEQEKATLLQDKTKLEADAKDVAGKLDSAKRAGVAAKKQLATLSDELQTSKSEAAELKRRLEEMTAKEQGTAQRLQVSEMDIRKLQGELKLSRGEMASCEAKNLALYGYGRDLLAKYEGKGVWTSLKAAEPFTQLERVKIENVLEEYRDKLDAEKLAAAGRKNAQPATTAKAN
jgi:chromosome segregation ATPase